MHNINSSDVKMMDAVKKTRKPRTSSKKVVEMLAPVLNEQQKNEAKIQTPVELSKEIPSLQELAEKFEKTGLNDAIEKSGVLSHLGNYLEQPFHILESYFEGQHLERLVRHQIESYNHFVNYQIQKTIQMFNPVLVRSDIDYVAEHDKYTLEIYINFENFKLYPPQIHENNGATKMMLPVEAKLRNFTYASTMTVDIRIDYVVRNTESINMVFCVKVLSTSPPA